MWTVRPTNSPTFSHRLPSRWVSAEMSKVMARTRLPTSTHQAMRLRAPSAPAITASAKAHAKLVSGKLNR